MNRVGGLLFILVVSLMASGVARSQPVPSTREMNLLGWQEFAELVPEHIETVLIPTGTLEAHGVLPNGSDNLAPTSMAGALAERLEALIAPTLNYGVTGRFDSFPGTFTIGEETYEAFFSDILTGLARNGFKNLIVLNGHGGSQTGILRRAAETVGRRERVRTLVTNWWSMTSEVIFEVYGENGGHAALNETAYIQTVVPEHVHPERYSADMVIDSPPDGAYRAYPFPSSIELYEAGEGYPDFDAEKAKIYYEKVNESMAKQIEEIIKKWDMAEIFRD